MSGEGVYGRWQPGGVREALGDVTLTTAIPGGAGHDFRQVGPGRYRCRARAGLEPYSWRLYVRIDSPGDGREILLEVADFNHFGRELWQEGAAVLSHDGEHWADLGLDRVEIVPWTPSGNEAEDASLDDGWHPPYGVRYRLRLDAPCLFLASPTPYTLERGAPHQEALAARCDFFRVEEIGRTPHGHPIRMTRVERPGSDEGRIRVLILAGEHPAESAGMHACEGLMEEILRASDLLQDFSFRIVPVVNVDGVALGRTYHALDPNDPAGPGVNLARDWGERSRPETEAIWRVLESFGPHCLVSLHNGRHRREPEVLAAPHAGLAPLLKRLREHLPIPPGPWRPAPEGSSPAEAARAGLAQLALCFETLLLVKLPGCETFRESYRRMGMYLLRALVAGLRDLYGRPQMLALRESLAADPVSCRASDFVAALPSFYYGGSFEAVAEHPVRSFEVNGLPLVPGHYDAWLEMQASADALRLRQEDGSTREVRAAEGWMLLPSMPIPARKLSFEFVREGEEIPFERVLIAPEGTPRAQARVRPLSFNRYVRRTRVEEKAHFRDWAPFHERLMADGFGADDLRAMRDEIVDWVAGRQVLDPDDPHGGAIRSEEGKYDARDAAAAAACFARRFQETDDARWRERALAARAYAYRSQVLEPGNARRHGGFVHMVQGIWGVRFTRLEPPYPGIDGVDTGVILHQLCRAIELGLPAGERDAEVLRLAAGWFAANEALPGVFLHHEGATHDCQNANAIGISALCRAYHALAAAGLGPPESWLEAAERGIRHYLEGQEAIGVWPYWFAQVGQRAGAYHFDNIPDHGIGLFHLTRACHLAPLAGPPGLGDMLRRAARWYLGVCRVDDDTIDLEYDRRPDLGSDICFSGFTWCRFTAAAALLRIGRITGETEPWRHLALRLMEHVRRKRWQRGDPERAPVVAHARPEVKLATWCQAAEWDASMLDEMIGGLGP